jgi:hypothetical protein
VRIASAGQLLFLGLKSVAIAGETTNNIEQTNPSSAARNIKTSKRNRNG